MTDITPFRTQLAQRLCQHFATLSDAETFKGRPAAHALLAYYAHHAVQDDDGTVRVGADHTGPKLVEAATAWYQSVVRRAALWLHQHRLIHADDDGTVTILSHDAGSEANRLQLIDESGLELAPTSSIASCW